MTGAEDGLPADAIDEARRLTRLARTASGDAERSAYRDRRAEVLDEHGYECRVRDDDGGETLVCYPGEWLNDDGTVRMDCLDDTGRAVEVSLSGPGDPDDWAAVDERNRAVVRAVRAEHGDVHGDNAAAFADFMSNHYARPLAEATRGQVEEFLTEYFPRNTWPSAAQRDAVEESLRLAFEAAGAEPPLGGE